MLRTATTAATFGSSVPTPSPSSHEASGWLGTNNPSTRTMGEPPTTSTSSAKLVQRQEVMTAASYVAAPALVHYLWMCPCTGLCYYYFIIFGCAPATTTTCEPVPAPMFQSATAGVSIPPQNPPPQENNTVITPQIPQPRCKEEEVLVVLWMLLMLLQTVASG